MVNDNSPNWAELYMLNKTAEAAILSGELDELRNANASTFHVLSIYLMDLNERITAIAQLMDSATLSSNQPPKPRPLVVAAGGGNLNE